MTTMCEAFANWEHMDRDERFAFLKDLIHQALADWGYNDVNVVIGDVVDPGADGAYNRRTDTITLDGNSLEEDAYSAWDAISNAIHETQHAMDDQDFNGSYDYGDTTDSSGASVPGPMHNALDLAAKAWTEARRKECEDAQSVESPFAEPLPPIDTDLT